MRAIRYIDGNRKRMSTVQTPSDVFSNSEGRIINLEQQIIHSCIRNKTGSKCDWNPNIGQYLDRMKEVDSQQ